MTWYDYDTNWEVAFDESNERLEVPDRPDQDRPTAELIDFMVEVPEVTRQWFQDKLMLFDCVPTECTPSSTGHAKPEASGAE